MDKVSLGGVEVSRFILGSNPMCGFSHRGPDMDREMVHYFTMDRIKTLLRRAESLGITTILGRTDPFLTRFLMEHWDQGGKLNWVAQTCVEFGLPRSVHCAVQGGASACYIHGGTMDYLFAQNKVSEAADAVKRIHDAGLPAGIAAHNPRVFEWAEEHLQLEYYMCCYYNPTPREDNPAHDPTENEFFRQEDRDRVVAVIAGLSRPVIHYKILAAGRNEPAAAFAFAARHMRPQDAACVGVYPAHNTDMLADDVSLFEKSLRSVSR